MQLVDKARDYLGLKALESATPEGGILTVHIGDALSSEATVEGGFAGISPLPSLRLQLKLPCQSLKYILSYCLDSKPFCMLNLYA